MWTGEGVNPPSTTKIYVFLFKEKKMQNILKRKNMYLVGFQVMLNFLLETLINPLSCK